MEDNLILFLDIDEAKKNCEICKKMHKKCKKLRNKSKFLQNIASNKKIYLISEKYEGEPQYLKFSRALTNYNQQCLKNCCYEFKTLKKPLKNYNLWSYVVYPKA